MTESIDVFLCGPTYNVRRYQDLPNSRQDVFNTINMDEFCVFAQIVLKHGGYGHIFCSAVQFVSWWQRFCTLTELVRKLGEESEVFEVEQTSLFYNRQQSNYLEDARFKRLRYTSVVEKAILFLAQGIFVQCNSIVRELQNSR